MTVALYINLWRKASSAITRHYSAFQLDPTGHVAGRINLSCIDDKDALKAEMLADTFGHDPWEDDRMIAVFRKKKPNYLQSFGRRALSGRSPCIRQR